MVEPPGTAPGSSIVLNLLQRLHDIYNKIFWKSQQDKYVHNELSD